MVAPALRRRFTVDDYYQMAAAGILNPADRVELIEGEIVDMRAVGALHADCVNALNDLLTELVGRQVRISVQNPVRLSTRSEPEPDLALVQRRRYQRAHPTPTDVYLLIEIADSSLDYDRGTKVPLYAREGIGEVWLVDLVGEAIERSSEPTPEGYRTTLRVGRGGSLTSTVLPDLTLRVDDVLGERSDQP